MKRFGLLALATSALGLWLGTAMHNSPVFASTTIAAQSYNVAYNAQTILHPRGFVSQHTTFMSAQDVLTILKAIGVHSAWAIGNLILGYPLPVDSPNLHPLDGKFRLYVDGQIFSTPPLIQVGQSTSTGTNADATYIPIWYVMKSLEKMGIKNSWNGHMWILGHLFA